MSKLVYKTGDLFAHLKGKKRVIVPHVCNVYGVFGAGFAATVREKYPDTNRLYSEYCKTWRLNEPLHYSPITLITNEKFGQFANMVCQTGMSGSQKRNATYPDLVKCMTDAVPDYKSNWEIYAPKFGAGLCGMNWEFIEELIKDIWIARDFNVTVFTI